METFTLAFRGFLREKRALEETSTGEKYIPQQELGVFLVFNWGIILDNLSRRPHNRVGNKVKKCVHQSRVLCLSSMGSFLWGQGFFTTAFIKCACAGG
jgi:hypothetical protein